MKNFFKKQREPLALIVYALLVFAIVWGVVFPLLGKIDFVKNKIQEENLRQQGSRERLSELPKIRNQFSELEKNESSLDVLLDKNNAVVLIEKLEKIADDSGDKITISVQDQTTLKTPPVTAQNSKDNALVNALPSKNYLQLRIALTGDFNSINKFVKSLESFEYYCDIIGMQIKTSDTTSSNLPTVADNSGMLDPFAGSGKTNAVKSTSSSTGNNLSAILDVVFYSK